MMFHEISFMMSFVVYFLGLFWLKDKKRIWWTLAYSYLVYAMWDWRFLFLLIFSTGTDYIAGLVINKYDHVPRIRKLALLCSATVNLGALAYFKYANFFIENFVALFPSLGSSESLMLNIILPAGISFYTFQSLSYTIDVYQRKIKAEKDHAVFFTFVTFFPQLVAGPIERASHLIHQIHKPLPITLERFGSGTRLFFWGLFLKLFVADNLGAIADPIFANPSNYPSTALIVAAYAFTFQIYGDFAGYSAMARGLARMCGYELSVNFNLPYFSSSIKEFWRRWHITLSTWFRDYVYYPLGGNQRGLGTTIRNLMIIFICSGIWHGAGWNFILWGFMHGAMICIETLWMEKFKRPLIGLVWIRRIITFHLVVVSWIIFRIHDADTMHQYIDTLWDWNIGPIADFRDYAGRLIFYLTPLLIIEWFQFKHHSMEVDRKWHWLTRSIVYAVIIMLILALGSNDGKQFIYFQF